MIMIIIILFYFFTGARLYAKMEDMSCYADTPVSLLDS